MISSRVAPFLAALSLVFVACGGDDDDDSGTTGGAAGSSAGGGGAAGKAPGGAGGTAGVSGSSGQGGSTAGTSSVGGAGGSTAGATAGPGGAGPAGSGGQSGTGPGGSAGTSGSAGSSGSGDIPATTCAEPIQAADVTKPDTVITKCDEATLGAALAKGGVITFDCGASPVTIPVTSELMITKSKDTVLDGGGKVTLDGGGKTRILRFNGGDYRKTKTVVTIQHLTLANAQATGGDPFPKAPAPCSQGFQSGGGGAILINDGILHVIDATFLNNKGATPGPDIAGGGIYATGSLGLVVVGSRFIGNSGANGGAIGMLNSDITVVNTLFDGNSATGRGANSNDPSKCSQNVNGQNEVGSGGNGAAISIDGGSDGAALFCGAVFRNNVGNALGGAIFRTPDLGKQTTTIDQCTFAGNQVKPTQDPYDASGGGSLYFHNSKLVITNTTFSGNTADGCGALQSDGTDLEMTNVTVASNTARTSPGGAICLFGNGAKLLNCTFEKNTTAGEASKGIAANIFGPGTAFEARNTLFANASSKDGGVPNCLANVTGSDDLQWPMSGNVCGSNGSTTFADPKLGALADNGGPTQTIAPAADSPARKAGHQCPPTDQTGKARPSDTCTLGALE